MKETNSVWKWIAGILVGILMSAAGTFYATTKDFATKTEMREALKPDHDMIKETRDDVKKLIGEVGELKGILDRK